MAELRGKELTFYAPLTGNSSFPVVGKALARWMVAEGMSVKLANLKGEEIEEKDLALHQIPFRLDGNFDWRHVGDFRPPRGGPGMLFGFPQWLAEVATKVKHSPMIGYHVGDVYPVPPEWNWLIERNCDHMLAPSTWGKDLLDDMDAGFYARVVHHGIDSGVFRVSGWRQPRGYRSIIFRHFSSSDGLERKGTLALLRAAKSLLLDCAESLVRGLCLRFIVSVPESTLNVAKSFELETPSGSLSVIKDDPRSSEAMAVSLRSCDFVVQPSRAEGFGMIPLEAIACGTPIVVTDCTGHADWIDDVRDAAVVVETGDNERCLLGEAPSVGEGHVREALIEAIERRERLESSAARLSHLVREKWEWKRVLDRELRPILREFLL